MTETVRSMLDRGVSVEDMASITGRSLSSIRQAISRIKYADLHVSECVDMVRRLSEDGLSAKQISVKLSVRHATICNIVRRLGERGDILASPVKLPVKYRRLSVARDVWPHLENDERIKLLNAIKLAGGVGKLLIQSVTTSGDVVTGKSV